MLPKKVRRKLKKRLKINHAASPAPDNNRWSTNVKMRSQPRSRRRNRKTSQRLMKESSREENLRAVVKAEPIVKNKKGMMKNLLSLHQLMRNTALDTGAVQRRKRFISPLRPSFLLYQRTH